MKDAQEKLLDLGCDISQAEIDHSQKMLGLLSGKKIVAVRILYLKSKEVLLEFDDGTRLFVNNFSDKYDVSITGGDA